MTKAEKDARARWQAYLLIAQGDVDKALALQKQFAPKDTAIIRKVVKTK
jgi:hypothetical protein